MYDRQPHYRLTGAVTHSLRDQVRVQPKRHDALNTNIVRVGEATQTDSYHPLKAFVAHFAMASLAQLRLTHPVVLPTLLAQASDDNYRTAQQLAQKSSVPSQTLARISANSDGWGRGAGADADGGNAGPPPSSLVTDACRTDGLACAVAAATHHHAHWRDRHAAVPQPIPSSEVLPMYTTVTDVSHVLHGHKEIGAMATTASVTLRGFPAPAGSILA
jgi:hypothetical protein